MTISLVWERTAGGHRELVFACDSKLTGGEAWEGCPKLFTFKREDCALAFAGDTYYAYPVAIQVAEALASYRPILDRTKDVRDIPAHIVAILNGMLDRRKECGPPETRFLFGGWSWRSQRFLIWKIQFSQKSGRYEKIPARQRSGGMIAYLGDPSEAESEFRVSLRAQGFFASGHESPPFDWEPLDLLCQVIRSASYRAVGGPPQVAKVYPFSKSQIFSVYWRDSHSEALTFRGRYTLPYELPDNSVLDVDTKETFNARGAKHLLRVRALLLRTLDSHRRRLEEANAPEGLPKVP